MNETKKERSNEQCNHEFIFDEFMIVPHGREEVKKCTMCEAILIGTSIIEKEEQILEKYCIQVLYIIKKERKSNQINCFI